jgi:hypothetical protein
VLKLFRRRRRADDFSPGDRVVYIPDGSAAVVNVSKGGWSHVYWDDEPVGESGGTRVRNSDLRPDPSATSPTSR